jgi:predicted component of type VI protein secretion system
MSPRGDTRASHAKEALMTSRTLLATFAVAALAACGGDRNDNVAAADSLSRDLQLAPVDSGAPLNDQPAAQPASEPAATPAPAPKPAAAKPKPKPAPAPTPAATPAPAPKPAAPASLAAGTVIRATMDDSISSRRNKAGETVTATTVEDLKDPSGRTVIPAGSTIQITITAIKESENKSDKTGTLTLNVADVTVNGRSYGLSAEIDSVARSLQGRKTNEGDVAKVGAGTAVGAVVGRVIGGSTKGAVIGGVIGGAVGTQRAIETKDRDVVVPAGSRIILRLTEKFTPAA